MNVLKSSLKRYISIALSTMLTLTCITPLGVRASTGGNITVDGNATRSVEVDKTNKIAKATYNVNLNLFGLDAKPSSSKKNVVIAVDWTSDSEQNIKNAINKVLIPKLRSSSSITHLNIGVVSMESGHARTRQTSTLRLYGLKGEGVDVNRGLDDITKAVVDSRPNGQRNLGDGLRLAYSNVKATPNYVSNKPTGYNPDEYDKYVVFVGGGEPNYYTSDRSSGYYYDTGEDGQGMSYFASDSKGAAYFKDIADKIYTSKTSTVTEKFSEGDKNIKSFVVGTDLTDDSSYTYVASKLSTTLRKASGSSASSINSIFTDIANSILYKEDGTSAGGSIEKAKDIASKITIDEIISSNLTLDTTSLNTIQSSSIANGVRLSNLPIKSVLYNTSSKAYEVKIEFNLNYKPSSPEASGLFVLGKDNLSKVDVSGITTLPLPEYKFTLDEDIEDSVTREVDVDKTNKKVNATYTIKANVKADNQGEVTQGSGKKNIVIAVDWTSTSKDNVINAIKNQLIPTIEKSSNITNLNVGIVSMESGHARTRQTSGLKLYALKGGGRDYDRNYDNINRALVDSYPDKTRNLGDGLRLAYSNVKAGSTNVVSAPSGYNINDYDKYVIFVGSGDAAYYTSDRNDGYYYGTVSDGSGLTCLNNSTKGKAYFRDIADKINSSKSGLDDVEFTKGDKNIKSFVVGTSLASNVEYNYVAGKIGTTLKEASASNSSDINNIFKGIADEIVKGASTGSTNTNTPIAALSSKISLDEYISSNLTLDTTSLNGISDSSISGGVKLSSLPIQSAVYNPTKGGYDIVSKFTVSYKASNVTPTSKYILGNEFKSKVNISNEKTLKLSKYEFTFDDANRINITNDGSEIKVKYKIKPGRESVGSDWTEITRIRSLENKYGLPEGRVVFEEYIKSNLKIKDVIPVTKGLKFTIDNSGNKVSLNPVLTEYKILDNGDFAIYKKGTTESLSELEFDVIYTLNGYYPFSVGSKTIYEGNVLDSYALYEKSLTKAYKQSLGNQDIGVNPTTISSVGLLKKSSSTDLTKYVDSVANKIDVANTGSVINFAMITDIKSQIPDIRVAVDFYKGSTKMTSSVFSNTKVTNITSNKLTVKGTSSQANNIIRVSFNSINGINGFELKNPKANDNRILENGALITQVVPKPERYLDNVIIKVPKGATKAVITVYDEYGNSTTKKFKEYTLANNSGSAASK